MQYDISKDNTTNLGEGTDKPASQLSFCDSWTTRHGLEAPNAFIWLIRKPCSHHEGNSDTAPFFDNYRPFTGANQAVHVPMVCYEMPSLDLRQTGH